MAAEKKEDPKWADRWKHPELLEQGFTPVANFFLRNYTKVQSPDDVEPENKKSGLNSTEAMLVIQLMQHIWDSTERARLSIPKIASRMDLTERRVYGIIGDLDKAGFLIRDSAGPGMHNVYSLDPLLEALRDMAKKPSPNSKGVSWGH